MKVAIIGSQGVPAQYGGFETLVEYMLDYKPDNVSITVYCSSKDFDKSSIKQKYKNAILKYIPLKANGIQSIPYDIISLFKSSRNHDVILILGVSGCIILPFFRMLYPKKQLITNIDGLEHKRQKWNRPIQKFLKLSEKLAVKYSNKIISDNYFIQKYVKDVYGKDSSLIAYGGDHVIKKALQAETKKSYNLPDKYAFKVCRIEPENNVELILNSFSKSKLPLVLIGNWNNSEFGLNLKRQYNYQHLVLLDAIYDQNILNQIRGNCFIYIHGHSAGGTNPSLVEAMGLGLPVFAFDCAYNRATTLNEALYFKDIAELKKLIEFTSNETLRSLGETMLKIARENYTWEKISNQYYELLK